MNVRALSWELGDCDLFMRCRKKLRNKLQLSFLDIFMVVSRSSQQVWLVVSLWQQKQAQPVDQ